MKRLVLAAWMLAMVALVATGCDASEEEDTGGVVTLQGQVLHAETNNPVEGAFVRAGTYGELVPTDAEGRFSMDVEIDSTMQLTVVATKNGFEEASTTVLVLAGRTVDVPVLRIRPTGEEAAVSGRPANILLVGQSAQSIGVRESGSEEVARLTFQLADSLGRPVVLGQGATVNFAFGAEPGGGAFLSPASAPTDNNGRAEVNLSAGTRAGVVQIVATASVDGRVIRSLPVSVSIHGGLPDAAHFSLGPKAFNFPALRTFGLANPVSVIVGDKYANPVKQGTAVYFTTTGGVVAGSVLTDLTGQGTVNLLSANPLPPDGVAVVTATTADENQQHVTARIPVLFTGVPVVTVTPSVARLGQTYRLTVTDPNGNPLAAGTTINVRVEGTKVKAVGHTAVRLDDTAFRDGARDTNGDGAPDGARDGDALDFDDVHTGPGITTFTFAAVENLTIEEEGNPAVESVTITVAGPNGGIELVLPRAGAALTRTRNATLVTRTDGTTTVRLAN